MWGLQMVKSNQMQQYSMRMTSYYIHICHTYMLCFSRRIGSSWTHGFEVLSKPPNPEFGCNDGRPQGTQPPTGVMMRFEVVMVIVHRCHGRRSSPLLIPWWLTTFMVVVKETSRQRWWMEKSMAQLAMREERQKWIFLKIILNVARKNKTLSCK